VFSLHSRVALDLWTPRAGKRAFGKMGPDPGTRWFGAFLLPAIDVSVVCSL
jgi:hypothetical protein